MSAEWKYERVNKVDWSQVMSEACRVHLFFSSSFDTGSNGIENFCINILNSISITHPFTSASKTENTTKNRNEMFNIKPSIYWLGCSVSCIKHSTENWFWYQIKFHSSTSRRFFVFWKVQESTCHFTWFFWSQPCEKNVIKTRYSLFMNAKVDDFFFSWQLMVFFEGT